MKSGKLTLLLLLSLWTIQLWGADLKIIWREGKDNLYQHPARLTVTYMANGKPSAGATIYRNEEPLGVTNAHGELITDALNTAASKYLLKACLGEQCSDKTSYQVAASEFPFPVVISMGSDPSVSMSLTWHTAIQVKATELECVKESDAAAFKSMEVNRSKGRALIQDLIDIDKPEGKKYQVLVHKGTFNGLTPNTKYLFRVGDGKHWAQGSFLTAPESGSKESVKFLFIADSQESSRENYQTIFKSVAQKAFEKNPDIRFIAHGGDMVNRGMNGQEWGWVFEAGSAWFSNYPLAPVVGNHETGGVTAKEPQQRNMAYLPWFNNPSNNSSGYADGSAYSFTWGAAHLTCLDIQNLDDAMEIKEKRGDGKYLQAALDWLRKDLASATTAKKWKIVTMHQPIYGANRDEKELRAVLAPIFDSCKVDLVITGHDHYYFRSFPMRYDPKNNDGQIVPMDQFGTVYVIGGSTCSKMYVQKYAKPYQAVVMARELFPGRYPYLKNDPLTLQNYSIFNVKQEELRYQFFDKNGNLKDEAVLRKEP